MSSNRHDYSHSSRGSEPDDRSLPPIREVVGDELDRPVRPSPYSFGDVRGALPAPGPSSRSETWGYPGYSTRTDHRGFSTLPPIQQQTKYDSSRTAGDSATSVAQRRHSSQVSSHSSASREDRSERSRTYAAEDPGYSYGVLRTSGTSGSLVHAIPPSDRAQGILRQTSVPAADDQEDLSKRYKCDYCGKRFGMPSHLQIHIRTHTAQRPFACEWPGCDRTFSVRSNMMRHFRSHGRPISSRDEEEDDDTGGDQYSREEASTSHYFHKSSSSRQPTSQYYSSSHRK